MRALGLFLGLLNLRKASLGPPSPHGPSLLLESGDYLLLESGDTILLE